MSEVVEEKAATQDVVKKEIPTGAMRQLLSDWSVMRKTDYLYRTCRQANLHWWFALFSH